MTTDEYRRMRKNKREKERRRRQAIQKWKDVKPAPKPSAPSRPRVKMCDEGADLLLEGIIRQAMLDYTLALKWRKCGRTKRNPEDCKESVEDLERWFASPYGQHLTGGSGERIIEECRRRCEEGVMKKWERPKSITG